MKILLTGMPVVGKTTLLKKFIEIYNGKTYGILTTERRDNNNIRIGFDATNLLNERHILTHKTKAISSLKLGNHFIKIETIDNFIVPELLKGSKDEKGVIILDEIAKIEASSRLFMTTIRELFNSDTNLLGTIVYKDEPFAQEFKRHPDVVLIEVTENNREQLLQPLIDIFDNLNTYDILSRRQKIKVLEMLRKYFSEKQILQISKLFNNAISCVVEDRISIVNHGGKSYKVKGNVREHIVNIISNNLYSCDCVLFKGEGKYKGKNGECSHIQAVKLSKV